MRNKSVLQEAQDIQKAVELIRLGARMQMLEVELPSAANGFWKLLQGGSRGFPRGMLPFSTDWFGVVAAEHPCLLHGALSLCPRPCRSGGSDAIVQACRPTTIILNLSEMEQVLSPDAGTWIRFFDAKPRSQPDVHAVVGVVVHAFDPTMIMYEVPCHVPSCRARPKGGLSQQQNPIPLTLPLPSEELDAVATIWRHFF